MMARSARLGKLETRSARLKRPVAKKPVYVKIGKGIGLGYRRNQTAGTWVARWSDGKGGNKIKAIGVADDFDEADGASIFDFWQAQDRARAFGRLGHAGDVGDIKLATIEKALDRYEANLRTRGGDIANVARVRTHLTGSLKTKTVALLGERELRVWRDNLAKDMAPASVNRTTTALKAALNLEADHDARILSRRPWGIGLATIQDAEEARNVILSDVLVRSLVMAAQERGEEFGLLVEVAAVTGARVSQLTRLEAQDIQGGRSDPRLTMPSSRKGRGQKKIVRRPVPVTTDLAGRLLERAKGQPATAPLLVKPSGKPWKKSDHTRLFKRAVAKVVARESEKPSAPKQIKLDSYQPDEVTIYALRHSNIVRQLLAGVPIRVVAANHDTSVMMIERTYSRHISDHADAVVRGALLDVQGAAQVVAEPAE
jgi:integrase